ncbi:MAG: hypothetical protein JWM96_800, partial [Alphaproteobacteria bacterium]|nr:hypothetical protein [Alphaproteobacteria bacterium]
KIFLRLIAFLFVTVTGVLLAVTLVISTQNGRDMLVHLVNDKTKNREQKILLGQVSGNILSDFTLSSLDLSDKDGVWLRLKDIHLVWHPAAFAAKAHVIDTVAVGDITVMRVPVPSTKEKPDEQTAFNIEQYASYVPRQLALRNITLEQPVTGQKQTLTAQATGSLENYIVALKTNEGPVTSLDAALSLRRNDIDAAIKLAEQPRGILGRLLKLPDNAGMHADIVVQTDYSKITTIKMGAIKIGRTEIALHGNYDHKAGLIDGRVALDVPDISEWQGLANIVLKGAMQSRAIVKGPLDNLSVRLQAISDHVDVAETKLDHSYLLAHGTIDAMQKEKAPFDLQGQLESTITLAKQQKPYSTNVHYKAKGTLEEFAGETNGTLKTPYGDSALHISGKANLAAKIFSALAKGDFIYQDKKFELAGKAGMDTRQMTLDDFSLAGPGINITGNGKWQKEAKLAAGKFSLKADDLQPLAQLTGVDLKGRFDADIALDDVDDKQQADMDIRVLNVTYDQQNIILRKGGNLHWRDGQGTLSPLLLSFADGMITAEGKMDRQNVAASVAVKQLSLEHFIKNNALHGVIDGNLALSGPVQNPVALVRAKLSGKSGNYPLDLALDGNWRQGRLNVTATGNSSGARAKALAELKTSLSLLPFKTDLSKATPVNGSVTADIPLQIFNPTLWASRQNIGGNLRGGMKMGGTLGTPQLSGRFSLAQGEYTNGVTGVCLRNVSADIVGSSERVALQNLNARDEKGGVMTASAQMGLKGDKPMKGLVVFRRLKLFCGGMASGDINGNLALAGILNSSAISGRLLLGPLNIQLPGAQHQERIPEVDTIRITDKDNGNTIKAENIMRLNIALDAPNQIFIRGRGLDAEFGGNLKIMGTATSPLLEGKFSARRGRFTLFDRVLQLAKADLRFEGPMPPSPFLDIDAGTTVNATKITIDLDGVAGKPQLTLSSQPSLPQDELLALLLFGRQLSTISPFQAIKLAQATRTLAGLDDGKPGVLDRARAKLGLDTLDLGMDDNNNVTVTTGKYVTDRVFVGVQQGTEPQDKQVKTEIEITPAVSANTTLDAEGNQGVGLGWRFDY